MDNEKQVFTEVYTVLSEIPSEYFEKIPKNVIEEISNKADTNYAYRIDELLPQSKSILIEIIRKYFGDEEMTGMVNKFITENIYEEERQKGVYKNDLFEKKDNELNDQNIDNSSNIAVSKESIFKRIINRIKSFFTRR